MVLIPGTWFVVRSRGVQVLQVHVSVHVSILQTASTATVLVRLPGHDPVGCLCYVTSNSSWSLCRCTSCGVKLNGSSVRSSCGSSVFPATHCTDASILWRSQLSSSFVFWLPVSRNDNVISCPTLHSKKKCCIHVTPAELE